MAKVSKLSSKDEVRSRTDLKSGCCNTQPRIGIFCTKTAIVGQNPLQEQVIGYFRTKTIITEVIV